MKKKDSNKKKGKMAALSGLRDMASKMMGDDLDKMKKVTVMAKDKKGLKAGLDKAEDMLTSKKKKKDEDEEEDEC